MRMKKFKDIPDIFCNCIKINNDGLYNKKQR